MKNPLSTLIARMRPVMGVVFAALAVSVTQAQTQTLFPYPSVPDSIADFSGRADYYVTHFWDHADMRRVFSNRQAFRGAFADYVSMLPHTTGDTSVHSVNVLLDRLKKQPSDLLFVAEAARDMLYGDTAIFWSDDLFIPFASAVAAAKKVPAAQRSEWARLAKTLTATRRGAVAPNPMVTGRDGSLRRLYNEGDTVTSFRIIFFNDPSREASADIRRIIDADAIVSRLVRAGIVCITAVYPGEATDEAFTGRLRDRVPMEWDLVAMPQAADEFDLRSMPSLYLLTGQGFIVEKNARPADVLNVLYRLRRLKAANPVLNPAAAVPAEEEGQ